MNMEKNQVYLGDCINLLPHIEEKSIDLILTDLPYEMTSQNEWDKLIDPKKIWFQFHEEWQSAS